jgi:transposase
MQQDTRTGRGRQGAQIVIGVDIAKATHLAVVQGPDGWRSKPLRVPNTAAGFTQLLGHAQAAETRWPGVPVGVALEPTGHYWLPLAHWLTARQIPVWLVNPAHTKWAKELEDNSPQKTDPKDARVIADLAAAGKARPCALRTGVYATLRALATLRRRVARDLTAVRNQLHRLCDQLFPEFLPCFGGHLDRLSCRALLAVAPTPEALLALGIDGVTAVLTHASHHRLGRARALVLVAAAQTSIAVREGAAPLVAHLHYLLADYDRLRAYQDTLEGQQATALQAVPYARQLLAVPGLGVVTVATLLGETGDLRQYARAAQLLKLAGLTLYEISSGQHQGQRRITKRGRPGLRRILYMAALRLVKAHGPFRGYYDRLTTRLNSTPALVAVMRKLLRVLYARVRAGELVVNQYCVA